MNIPEGWKLVPVEPTEEMIDAACEIDARGIVVQQNRAMYAATGQPIEYDYATHEEIFAVTYKAALAAAPMPPEQQCGCGDRPASLCPGEWEPGCDLGANEKYVRVSRQPPPEQQSRAMFVARLENMAERGDKWLTVQAVLALLNDCDMRAPRDSQLPAAQGELTDERIKFVPVDSRQRTAAWNHPTDDEPCPRECKEALNQRGDDRGQGLDSFWKWGFKAGWNACATSRKRSEAEVAEIMEAADRYVTAKLFRAGPVVPDARAELERLVRGERS